MRMRQPHPWRRGAGGSWYAQLRGKQTRLAGPEATKSEAQDALNRLLADGPSERPAGGRLLTRDCFNLFLANVEAAVARGERAAVTFEGYVRFLVRADRAFGRVAAGRLRPGDVTAWLDATGWGATTRANAVTAVK